MFLFKSWMNWRRRTVRRQLNFLQSALKHTTFLILPIKSHRGSYHRVLQKIEEFHSPHKTQAPER